MSETLPIQEQKDEGSHCPAAVVDSEGDCAVGKQESPEFLRLKNEGNELFQQERYTDAIEKYKEAQAHAKTNEQIAALLHNEGYSYDKMGNKEKALELYSEAVLKKAKYIKVLKRRAKLLCDMKRYQEAFDDMVEVIVEDLKERSKTKPDATKLPDFATATSQLLVDIIISATEYEAQQVLLRHRDIPAPVYVVESMLRIFFGDPVSRMWRGLDPSPVDKLIAEGKGDSLTGYNAALRDLKLRKYDNIIQLCTEEIQNPNAPEEEIINARFLRGTMTFIWSLSQETVDDFTQVTVSPVASKEMKSSAYVKLGMRHTNTRNPFANENTICISDSYGKAEEIWLENPDVYFHGSMFLVDRASPLAAVEMLELGMKLCDPLVSVLMGTFYWTLKLTITDDEKAQREALYELDKLEARFDIPECYEMVAQALMALGGESKQAEYNDYFDKAIALNPRDPTFKIKKIIFRHWLGDVGSKVNTEAAVEEMLKFIETEGPTHLAYYHVGQLEVNRGNFEKGFEAFEKSIELSGSIHEIEARIANKLEIQFHSRVNERLKKEGEGDLAEQMKRIMSSMMDPSNTPPIST